LLNKPIFLFISIIIHLLLLSTAYLSQNESHEAQQVDIPVMLYTLEESQVYVTEPIEEPIEEVEQENDSNNNVALALAEELQEANHTKSELIGELKIRYPNLSKRKGEEGIVSVSIYVTEYGECTDVTITKSSGYHRLDEATIKALLNMKYYPATENEIKVNSWNDFEVIFKLTDE